MGFRIERFSGRRSHVSESGAVAGFTLVELLVVISIIALLISILLPSLKKAREQAKVAVCTANMKGIASASVTYASSDRSEQSVPVHWALGNEDTAAGQYEWGGKSGQGEPIGGSNAVDSQWGTKYGRGPASRPLNDVLYKGGFTEFAFNRGPGSENWINDYSMELGTYRCPSDTGYSGHHFLPWKNSGLTSYDHYGNSYATNALWTANGGDNPCRYRSNSPFIRPISRVSNPANTVYYLENAGRFAWRINYGDENDQGCTSRPGQLGSDVDTAIKGWHGRPFHFVAAFVDAHAGVVKMQGHRQPAPQLSFYPPNPLQPDLVYGYNGWRCVIIRGPGWQIDTLPSAPVQTQIECNSGVPASILD